MILVTFSLTLMGERFFRRSPRRRACIPRRIPGRFAAVIIRSPTRSCPPGALLNHIPDDVFVQRVGGGDFAIGEAGFVQHFAGLFAQVGDVARIDPAPLRPEAAGEKLLIEYPDGVRNTRLQCAVGVYQQGAGSGDTPAHRRERRPVRCRRADPAVGHGAEGGMSNSRSAMVQAVPAQPPI